jgi:tetratricopeptide (TPR) repeat protein
LTGNTAEAKHEFDALLKTKYKSQLSAEILMQSSRYQLDYPPAVTLASAAAQKGTGKPFARVNHALGKHYLWKKKYLKAAALLENARDKSNKNRIEFNDPLLLVDLSVASYRVKRFSESLEIYFAMSKQFPAVRQIQMVMQGVYSMEQKSAGDAKIF